MFYLVLAVHPHADNPEHGTTEGGFATCWVRASLPAEAESVARGILVESGWEVEEVIEDPRPIAREEYADDAAKLELIDEAEREGVAMTLHTWEVGAHDDDHEEPQGQGEPGGPGERE